MNGQRDGLAVSTRCEQGSHPRSVAAVRRRNDKDRKCDWEEQRRHDEKHEQNQPQSESAAAI